MAIADLLGSLTVDSERARLGFSEDLQSAGEQMLSAASRAGAQAALNAWIGDHQPCLFGRAAAKRGLLTYCILDEKLLESSDADIRTAIQDARSEWTRRAFEGETSGFIIAAVHPQLAVAAPDPALMSVALRLCSLYLLHDVEPDEVYHDEVFLERPGRLRATWKWLAGVNVFASAGDRRWWLDHRIPGGIAFSVNSVGHMVKSGALARAVGVVDQAVGAPKEAVASTGIDSLTKALELAMRTIDRANNGPSGRATRLIPAESAELPNQLKGLPADLALRNWDEYEGYYHTDETVPSIYFRADVERPPELEPRRLEFRYLYLDALENPDHVRMGAGRRIRGAGGNLLGDSSYKVRRTRPVVVPIETTRLMKARRPK